MRPFANHPDELISASLSGELTGEERRQLEAHLAECPECRATLAAFGAQRELLAALPQPPAPRDLGARVRAGIESGRLGRPWWGRPATLLAGVASLATVAAAALLVIFLTNGSNGPNVGRETASPTPTPAPAASVASVEPSVLPSPSEAPSGTPAAVPIAMQPGDLLYTQVTGPYDGLTLALVNAQANASITIGNPAGAQYGAIERSALSPDGRLLALATDTGLKGTLRIFVVDLVTGTSQQIAETLPAPFGERLAWSPDGRYLAFTAAPLELASQPTDVWLYDRVTSQARQLTREGNVVFASWAPLGSGDSEQLWVSQTDMNLTSVLVQFPVDGGIPSEDPLARGAAAVIGVYAPLVSPDGTHVLYWTGTYIIDQTGSALLKGGMPQLAAYDPTTSTWSGKPLFSDLVVGPNGGAFASGRFSWAADSDALAFWSGQWTGTPEGADYPDVNAVYFGRVSTGPLSQASALSIGSMTSPGGDLRLVDVELAPDGGNAGVTLGIPLAGDLSSPQSYLRIVATSKGASSPTDVGGSGANPPWSGPAIFVPARTAP